MKKYKAITTQVFFSFGSLYNETEESGLAKITQVEALKYRK